MELPHHTATLLGGIGQWNPYNEWPQCLGTVGSGTRVRQCPTAWGHWAPHLLQCTASLPGGSVQCNSYNAVPHCPWAVGISTLAMHSLTASRQWAMQLVLCSTTLPSGSGRLDSCNALSHCLGAVGSATRAMQCHTARGQYVVKCVQCAGPPAWGTGSPAYGGGRRLESVCGAWQHPWAQPVGQGVTPRRRPLPAECVRGIAAPIAAGPPDGRTGRPSQKAVSA